MRPKSPKRKGALGMNAPGAQYDPNTIAQMQAAIDNLSGQVGGLTEQKNNLEAKLLAVYSQPSGESSQSSESSESGASSESSESSGSIRVDAGTRIPRDVSTERGERGNSLKYSREDHVHYFSPQSIEVNLTWQVYNPDFYSS